MEQPLPLSYLDLLLAALLIAGSIVLSIRLQLGLERDMAWGAVRTFLQLLVIGFVLAGIFSLNRWYWQVPAVVGSLAFMLGVAVHTARGRITDPIAGKTWIFTAGIVSGSLVVLLYILAVVVRIDPWYDPRYVLPLAGMIIGNGMTSATLAVGRFVSDLRHRRLEVETALALGATTAQAVARLRRDALRTAITPSVNSMLVVGLVSLPGMMTGQILANQSPVQAAHYQVMVMYMITAAASFTSVLALLASQRTIFTPAQQVRADFG